MSIPPDRVGSIPSESRRVAARVTFLAACAAILLNASQSRAQGPFTSPPGYLTTEGRGYGASPYDGYADMFGSYATVRFQLVDGEIRDRGAQVLSAVGVRADDVDYDAATGAGRRWASVALDLCAGDHATMTRTFASNQRSTPTRVFSGSVRFPARTGKPATRPAPWSADYRFPFAANYAYTAQDDLCLDWSFAGGTLDNGAGWATGQSVAYQLDGLYWVSAVGFGSYRYRYAGTQNNVVCADSSVASSSAWAQTSTWVGLYSAAFELDPSWAGRAILHVRASNVAPNAPLVHALNLQGATPGVSIGAQCYNLMIDTTNAVFLHGTSDSYGYGPRYELPLGALTQLRPFGRSVSFWGQSAWTDSATRRFALTAAEKCTPDFAMALDDKLPKLRSIRAYDLNATSAARDPASAGPFDHPLLRYN